MATERDQTRIIMGSDIYVIFCCAFRIILGLLKRDKNGAKICLQILIQKGQGDIETVIGLRCD